MGNVGQRERERLTGNTDFFVPDLRHGSITIGVNSGNSWKTHIESVLSSEKCRAFLATDCRAEFVAEKGDLIGRRYSEVSVISTTDKDYIIRAGTGIWHPFKKTLSEGLHYGEFGGGTRVSCQDVDVKMLSFSEFYEDVIVVSNDNNLYMKISYVHEGVRFEIVCPCRYTNFLNPEKTQGMRKYVQPISGYVLFEHNGRYHQAYIVAYVDETGTKNCEVVLRVPKYIMDLKQKVGGMSTSVLSMIFSPFRSMLLTDEFCSVIKLEANVSFFRYEN